MKAKNIKLSILVAGALSLGLVSCKKEGCTDPNATNYSEEAKKDDGSCEYADSNFEDVTINGQTYTKITGTITESVTLQAAKKYLLSGGVFVDNGATLTIEAGTMIYAADDNTIPFLAIQRGANIMASGTESNPIVFTTIKSNPMPGDWGGIIINGYAPVNNGVDPMGEGNTGLYGGNDAADNSGVMRYVRVEYAGKQFTADKELNGFAFYAVGSGTTLEYLQAYKNSDDGFEFFGGTVDLTHALSYGSGDDSFDYTYGWSGTGNFWRGVQSATEGDRGIEADNNAANNAAAPFSNPTLSNIELGGRGTAAATVGAKFREGTKAIITNLVVTDFATGIDIEHDQTLSNILDASFKINSATTTGCTTSIVYKGSKDANGNVINPQLVTDASASSNAQVNGSATAGQSWISGSWFRNL